jgi:hypothetical protein
MGPQVSLIVLAFPHPGSAEWLAWVAARDDVNRLHVRPVHLGDVAEIWHARVMRFHDLAGGWLYLGIPGQIPADGHI